MRKAAIITILDNTNYGTYLQALALGLVIKNLGYKVEIIDYVRSFMTRKAILSRSKNPIKKIFNALFNIPQQEKLKKKDKEFLQEFIQLTPQTYTSFKALKDNPPIADIYITGSDQVWNSTYNRGIDKSYYLDFAPQYSKRISYASSICMEDFPTNEKNEVYKLLKQYTHITVRENDAKNILSRLSIENVDVVLDPTLLLNKKDWENIIAKFKPIKTPPFILVYTVETDRENKLIEYYAKIVSKKYSCPIYEVSYNGYLKRLKFADKHFLRATPSTFIQLMAQAKFVIVSSFHGTAFSINFNKQFLTITPNRFNSRVNNILKLCHLESRLVNSENYDIENIHEIDFMEVNTILDNERNKSLAKLNSMLEFPFTNNIKQ